MRRVPVADNVVRPPEEEGTDDAHTLDQLPKQSPASSGTWRSLVKGSSEAKIRRSLDTIEMPRVVTARVGQETGGSLIVEVGASCRVVRPSR